MDRAGPARLKTVESPLQKYPEACVWQPTSNLLVLFKFFVGYSFLVSRPDARAYDHRSSPVAIPLEFLPSKGPCRDPQERPPTAAIATQQPAA